MPTQSIKKVKNWEYMCNMQNKYTIAKIWAQTKCVTIGKKLKNYFVWWILFFHWTVKPFSYSHKPAIYVYCKIMWNNKIKTKNTKNLTYWVVNGDFLFVFWNGHFMIQINFYKYYKHLKIQSWGKIVRYKGSIWGVTQGSNVSPGSTELSHFILIHTFTLCNIFKRTEYQQADLLSSRKLLPPMCIYHRRQWHPTPVLLSGKSHGWRSLVGCSPWGH